MSNYIQNFVNKNGNVIAEIACGHNGSEKNFKKIIKYVKKTGCKIIKSQIFLTEERTTPNHSEWEIFKKLTLSEKIWINIVKEAKKEKLIFFADIFGDKGLKIAIKAKVDGFKIHSENLLDYNFIEKVTKLNKPTLLGIGGSYKSELIDLVEFLHKKKLTNKIILMPGIQNFPTSFESHSLFEIKDLISKYGEKYKIHIGCADHLDGDKTEAIEFPLLAMAAGASILEKHFTINRKMRWEDYESALDYTNFKKFVKKTSNYSKLLIGKEYFSNDEKNYRNKFKKVAIFKNSLKKNHRIKSSDIEYIKVDKNINSLPSEKIVNQITKKNVIKGQIISCEMLNQKVGAIIVVRNSSKRLKSKALKKILGKESISCLIERIKRCKHIDQIVLATTKEKEDDIFIKIANKYKIKIFRGDKLNVAKRFHDAAEKFKIDHIVRITGDDILRDNVMIDKAIKSHLEKSAQVTITTNMPYGTQTEIFSLNVIKLIVRKANAPENTEYLEWFLQNSKNFNVSYVRSDYKFDKKIRLTLDYKEDFELFKYIFEYFKSNKTFNLVDVLKLFKKLPKLKNINSLKKTKFKTFINKYGLISSDQIDTTLNI